MLIARRAREGGNGRIGGIGALGGVDIDDIDALEFSHGGGGGTALGSQGAVQQLNPVEVVGVRDTVNFILQLVDFPLEAEPVHGIVVGAVGRLGGQVVHAVEHVLDFLNGAFGGLHQGDAVLDVFLGGVQARDLGAPLLGNSQASGGVASAVNFITGRQLLQVLRQGGGVRVVVAAGIYSYNIVLNTHDKSPYINAGRDPCLRPRGPGETQGKRSGSAGAEAVRYAYRQLWGKLRGRGKIFRRFCIGRLHTGACLGTILMCLKPHPMTSSSLTSAFFTDILATLDLKIG